MRVPRASRVRVDLRVFVVALTMLVVLVAAERASAVDRIQRTGMLNGTVRAISGPDADGNRYLGGDFTAFSPWETGAGTVVDASTGAVDPSFPKVAPAGSDPANVFDSEPDGSGGVFIAGEFGSVDGQPRYGLARILVDGSVDPAWTAGLTVGAGSYISDIELVGGVLYVVGSFSGVAAAPGGAATTRYNAAAFDVSTGALKNWNPATNVANTGAPGPVVVASIAIGSGQAFLGGNFTCLNVTVLTEAAACPTANPGVERTALAAVDLTTGAVVAAFNAALGGGSVEALALEPEGDWLYLGGTFSTVNGQPRTNAAVIRTNGTNTVGASWAPNPDATVFDLVLRGSSIFLGGSFTNVASESRTYLAEVTRGPSTPATATSLSVGFGSGLVRSISIQGSDLYVGGLFAEVAGRTRQGVAKLSLTGALDPWNPGIEAGWTVFTVGSRGSQVLIGGGFSQAGGEPRAHAAAVDEDGYLTDWSVELNDSVNAVAVADGKVFLGGEFTTANGETRNGAAAFDAAGDLDQNWDPNLNGTVYAMTVVGSTVYIGGAFQTAGGATRNGAAAFSTAGGLNAWDPDLNSEVLAMTSLGSVVYLGGGFSTVGGGATTRNSAAAFDTSGALVSGWNPDLDDSVYAMTALGSTIYLGGRFRTASGMTRNRAAAFSATGAGMLLEWNPDLDDRVNAVAASGSTVYVGGEFEVASSETRYYAAAFSATGAGGIMGWNPDLDYYVWAMAASGSTVYMGGEFTTVGGVARTYSAAVSADGTLLDPWPRLGPPTLYALTVTQQGSGSGTVTSSPAGIDCGATCASSVRAGRTVTLTAAAAAGSTFAGWGGACSGTAATCAVTMDQARSVTAQFDAQVTPPDPDPRTSSLRVVSARPQARGQAVVIRVRVSGAGRVGVVGSTASTGASRVRVCRSSRSVTQAGVVTVTCRLNRTGRVMRTMAPLRIRLGITFVPSSGETRTATRVVRMAKTGGRPDPVTG